MKEKNLKKTAKELMLSGNLEAYILYLRSLTVKMG